MTDLGYRYRKEMLIDAMIVDEKERGKGIGTSLLKYVFEYDKSKGCTDVRLTVNEENVNAIKVYEKLGMKVKYIAYCMQLD